MSYDSEVSTESLEAVLRHHQMTQAQRNGGDVAGRRADETGAGGAAVSDKWKTTDV